VVEEETESVGTLRYFYSFPLCVRGVFTFVCHLLFHLGCHRITTKVANRCTKSTIPNSVTSEQSYVL
jgi:hypothetical protein